MAGRPKQAAWINERKIKEMSNRTTWNELGELDNNYVMERRGSLALVDIGATFAEEFHHLLGAKSRGPVEQSLAHVVHKVDFDATRIDGIDQGVRVFAADAVNQLTVRPLSCAVQSAQHRSRCAAAAAAAASAADRRAWRRWRRRTAGRVGQSSSSAAGQSFSPFEEENQEQVDESHRIQNASLLAVDGPFDGVRQFRAEKVVGDSGRSSAQSRQ
jgi:hypothetical protein